LLYTDAGLPAREVVRADLRKDFVENCFRAAKTLAEFEPVRHRREWGAGGSLRRHAGAASRERVAGSIDGGIGGERVAEGPERLLGVLRQVERVRVRMGRETRTWYRTSRSVFRTFDGGRSPGGRRALKRCPECAPRLAPPGTGPSPTLRSPSLMVFDLAHPRSGRWIRTRQPHSRTSTRAGSPPPPVVALRRDHSRIRRVGRAFRRITPSAPRSIRSASDDPALSSDRESDTPAGA